MIGRMPGVTRARRRLHQGAARVTEGESRRDRSEAEPFRAPDLQNGGRPRETTGGLPAIDTCSTECVERRQQSILAVPPDP